MVVMMEGTDNVTCQAGFRGFTIHVLGGILSIFIEGAKPAMSYYV